MITAAHVILFTPDATADRAFLRDTLGLDRSVDAGDGWLIFRLPPAEVAVHPVETGQAKHELYLLCDNIEQLIGDLRGKGVPITHEVSDQGWGLLASIRLPSGAELSVYEPRHPVAYTLP
jgi:catechol 2,3-dioxygenase-like lactoylglutathione lyase family enzyme